MNVRRTCPTCGAELGPDTLEGLCPECVVRVSLGLGLSTASGTDAGAASEGPRVRRFGDYELLAELGEGGMGVVFKARQVSLNRLVALKMIRAGLLASEAEVKRFLAEAEVVASLDHPQVVPIYEVRELDGQRYFAMKLIEGGNLATRRAEFLADPRRAAALVAQVARAVQHAHQRGVLHRDLKPANILLDESGNPYVTDFGLAKRMFHGSGASLTHPLVGTPAYMAPEQATGPGTRVTTAADVYSLGAVLYELLGGKPPFCGDTPIATLRQVVDSEPTPPRRLNAALSPELEAICLKCLEKLPDHRYLSAHALAEDLERWLRHEPVTARPTGWLGRVLRWGRRKPVTAALTAATALALVLGVTGVTWQWRRAERESRLAREAAEELWQAVPVQARAGRFAGDVGRRERTLESIHAASQVRPSAALRDEAIATLALLDLAPDLPDQAQNEPGSSIAFDPDLEHCASYSSAARRVRVLRVRDQHEVMSVDCPRPPQDDPRFSPDGRFLAVRLAVSPPGVQGETCSVMVWRLDTARKVLHVGSATTISCDYAPQAPRLAVLTGNGTLRWFDLESGVETALQAGVPAGKIHLAPDGHQGAIIPWPAPGSDEGSHEVLVWDLAAGRPVATLELPGTIHALAWSPAGAVIALGCADRKVHLWRVATREHRTLSGHEGLVHHVAFDPEGDWLVSNGYDGTTRLWAVNCGQLLMMTQQGYGRRFSRDGRRLAYFRTLQSYGLWRVLPSPVLRLAGAPWGPPAVLHAEFSPDEHWLALTKDDGVRLLTLPEGRERSYAAFAGARTACYLPNGASLCLAGTEGLRLCPVSIDGQIGPGQPLSLPGLGPVGQMRISADGQQALVLLNAEARVLDLATPAGLGVAIPVPTSMARIAFSPDKRWVATFSGMTVGAAVFEAQSGRRLQVWGTGGFRTVAFSHDGQWCAEAAFDEVTVRETASWTPRYRLARQSASDLPGLAAFSRDGRWLAITKNPRLIQLLETATGQVLASLQAPDSPMLVQLFFSADAQYLGALTADHTVQIWRLAELRRRLGELGLDWANR